MQPTSPLALYHSWPLADACARFDAGQDGAMVAAEGTPIARWQCDLATQALTWEKGVFALFGLPLVATPTRRDALPIYEEGSRAAMERLRSHALRHRRGFTLDALLHPADGAAPRWIRLVAAPVIRGGRAVAIAGTKQDVSHLYRVR